MGEFVNALSAVFLLFLLMSVGYMMGRAGWMGAAEKNFLSRYILFIAVPCNCLTGLLNRVDREMLLDAWMLIMACFCLVLVSLLLAAAIAQLLKLPRRQKGVFIAMAGFSNTLFIGLPMSIQLFGEVSIPYVMFYYLASTILVQTVGVMLLSWSGGGKQERSPLGFLRDVLSKPPVVAVLVSVLLLLFNLRPPALVMSFAGYISNTVSPLALIYCGYIIFEVGITKLRFSRGIPAMLAVRLVVAPVLCMGFCALFGVGGLARSVFIVESALPVVTQVTVMAGMFGADEQYAASGACLSTIGCFISIPILMVLIG